MSAFTQVEQGSFSKSAVRMLGLAFIATIGLFAMLAISSSSAQAATVTNPGPNNMVLEEGFLKVGDTLENSINDLDPKPALAGSIDGNGNIVVPQSSFNFGTLEFEVDTEIAILGRIQGVIGIEIIPTHDVTGVIDPLTGEADIRIRLRIRAYRISGSSLLDVGNNCNIGTQANPIDLNMNTWTEPIATNTPDMSFGGRSYSLTTGSARFADKSFSVPGQSGCSGLAAGQINGLLGLPSGSGLNAAEFEMSFDPAPISNATININTRPAAATNQTNANFGFTTDVAPPALNYECRRDGGTWTACNSLTASYTGLSDGSHTFQVRALVPDTENVVGSASYSWNIDTVIPVYTINGAPTGLVNTRNANLTFTVQKTMPPGSARCSLDGATPTPCTSPQNLTNLPDGPHTFTVSGTDSVGNFGSNSRSWTVDATKPVISDLEGPVGVSSTADVDFTFNVSDNMTANPVVQCQIRNLKDNSIVQAFTNCSSPYHQVRPTGKWQLLVRATDNAGNVSDIATYDWQANTAEPVIIDETYTFNGEPTIGHRGGTTSSDAEFEFEAATYELDENDEPVVIEGTDFTYECWLDGDSLGACESPMTLHDLTGGTPIAEGSHTFEVKPTTVAAPPVEGTRTAFSWSKDTVNPTAAIADGPALHNNSSTASFVLNINGTGSQGTAQCKLDNQANWSTCDSDTAHDVAVSDGSHLLQVRAIDQAGNTSQAVSHQWNADTVDPLVALRETPQDNDPSSEASFVFETNDDDNNVQALCQIDNGSEVPCDSRTDHTFENVSDGLHTFTITAKDRAGNTSSIDHEWRVDTTNPALDITAGPAALTIDSNAAFKIQSSDGGSGIDEIACRIDNGSWVTGADCKNGNEWNFYPGPYASGNHTIQVRTTDKAGNQTSRSWTWKIDRTAPDVAIATQIGETKSTTASIEFVSSESASSFECKVDAGTFEACTSPKSLSDLSVGNHVFSVRSVDQAGNKSVEDSLAWTVLAEDPTEEVCPDGKVGTPPNCEDPPVEVCPDGKVGTPPNCEDPPKTVCAADEVGTPPNCKKTLAPSKPKNGVGAYNPKTGKLQLRLLCPKGLKPKCQGTAVAVTKKKGGKAMSSKAKNTSRAGKFKVVTLTIKPAYRDQVALMTTVNKKQLIVKQTLRSKKQKKKKTVFHTYKVRVKG